MCMGISTPGLEFHKGVQNARVLAGMLGPCLEFHACLANYNLIGCQDVALILGAVSWCLKGWPRTPEPKVWLGFPQTHAQAGKVGLGVGLDCQTDTRAHTPPSKAPLPPEQRKASF